MTASPLDRLRALCLALPEAREVEAWGAPTFRVKTIFAMYAGPDERPGRERPAAWIKADPADQDWLVRSDPDRFFVPPYVGPKGWVGVHLDGADTDWEHVTALLVDAWKVSAPKKLVEQHAERLGL